MDRMTAHNTPGGQGPDSGLIAEYEWGVVNTRDPRELHRGPMSEADARLWVEECLQDFLPGVWQLVRRQVGPWELHNDGTVCADEPHTIAGGETS